ncbi:hypothetical protein GPL15_09950 [Clostridium sp. MCC353]|uniref:tripartite tricarboxylate transporter permease n=1 Tax=Clostridium sp. MCC353 TaxID=2592646 RepID=UPI001C030D92|nr:tripartite tricarboxylate transporter permease [Clostridium sp. MCC353]MBT9776825.1 hypothetical protein [Clostridium sp. MCC353]
MFDQAALLSACGQLFVPSVMLIMCVGVFTGILCGAVPGISASMAVGVALPITFSMPAINAMVFLCSVYAGACYGGSITAVLLNTPGTPSAACTVLDGFPMTKRGEANRALGLSLGASCVGGIFSYVILFFFTGPVAGVAIKFGPSEMFLLAILGLMIIGTMKENDLWKSLTVGIAGIIAANVGTASDGRLRMYFGQTYLMDGMPEIPVIMGMFAFAELFTLMSGKTVVSEGSRHDRSLKEIIKGTLEPLKHPVNLLRSSVIGTGVGAIPAAGSTIAAFVAYNQAKLVARNPKEFGNGAADGIIACETANNASTGGALMTMFALGIPGGAATAIMLGALTMQGLQPGPRMFSTQTTLVYTIILSLFVSQIVMYFIGLAFSYSMSNVLNISTKVLTPVLMATCIAGVFSVKNNGFYILLMIIFAALSIIMKKNGYPPLAFVMGVMLGNMADEQLCRANILYKGDWTVFITRPISLVILLAIIVMIFYPIYKDKKTMNKEKK